MKKFIKAHDYGFEYLVSVYSIVKISKDGKDICIEWDKKGKFYNMAHVDYSIKELLKQGISNIEIDRKIKVHEIESESIVDVDINDVIHFTNLKDNGVSVTFCTNNFTERIGLLKELNWEDLTKEKNASIATRRF